MSAPGGNPYGKRGPGRPVGSVGAKKRRQEEAARIEQQRVAAAVATVATTEEEETARTAKILEAKARSRLQSVTRRAADSCTVNAGIQTANETDDQEVSSSPSQSPSPLLSEELMPPPPPRAPTVTTAGPSGAAGAGATGPSGATDPSEATGPSEATTETAAGSSREGINVTTQVGGNRLGVNEFRKEIKKCIEETTQKAMKEINSSVSDLVSDLVSKGVQEIDQDNRHKNELREKNITIGVISTENNALKIDLQEKRGELHILERKYEELRRDNSKLVSENSRLVSDMASIQEKNTELVQKVYNHRVSMCTMCYSEQINIVALPCFHASFCDVCCNKYVTPREGYEPPIDGTGHVRCPHCNVGVVEFHQMTFCSI